MRNGPPHVLPKIYTQWFPTFYQEFDKIVRIYVEMQS